MTRTTASVGLADERGIALIAVLIAVTMLLLLSLPFAVAMSRGADAATHAIEQVTAEQLSASVREDLLSLAAQGHGVLDATPMFDDRTEYPDAPSNTFKELQLSGRARFGGEVYDLQRFLPLNAGSPLLFANVLGLTARLAADFTSDATSIALDDATKLPDTGVVWLDHEVIRYGQKQGSTLRDLTRSMFVERGFMRAADHETVKETALVLDWRCVLAAAWSFDGRTGGTCKVRHPLRDPRELSEVEASGFGGFTAGELDLLSAAFHGETELLSAPTYGRPERLFADVAPPYGRELVVKGALSLGAGSVVRLRNLKTNAAEFGLVMSSSSKPVPREILLPSEFRLFLLYPVTQEFPAIDSVVEPLLPATVNINTAGDNVLAAIFAHVRHGLDVRVHNSDGNQRPKPQPPVSFSDAHAIADQIVSMRSGNGGHEGAAFAGWQEVAERIFRPRFQATTDFSARSRWIDFYRNLLTGRDSAIEMGTAALCFQSGPLVGYRAAASLQRSAVAPGIAARHERTGTAVTLPGFLLQKPFDTQEQLEEAFRLDQRSAFFLTTPVNTSSTGATDPGNEPASRATAHVVGMAFPELGLGSPRFPSRDRVATGITLSPSSVPPSGQGSVGGHEAFSMSLDPRGHDVSREGPFLCRNTGPRENTPPPAPAQTHKLTHPFTTTGGFAGRFAASFWAEPESLGAATLFDYSDGNRERNRMAMFVRDGNLVYEVLDEAGLDPLPNRSPAGVPRTAGGWRLPLNELSLPARTPVHISVSASSNRPGDLSVAIDGIARGKVNYRTHLTAPVAVMDPSIRPSGSRPGNFASNDPLFIDLQVDSVEGFPPMGVVRVGIELFEYSEVQGNTLRCRFRDSLGGRSRRQSPREMRIDLKPGGGLDPAVDFNKAGEQNRDLEVFPEHPVGSEVELYGYSLPIAQDTLVQVGETRTNGVLGGFALARAYIQNGRPIALVPPQGPPIQLGTGLDINYTGDINLVDPPKLGVDLVVMPPAPADAPKEILEAFSVSGGFALLVQRRLGFTPPLGVIGTSVEVGGMELVWYAARQGAKLTGVRRAASLPAMDNQDGQIGREIFDGTARQFVTDWDVTTQPRGAPRPASYDLFPQLCVFVVPISFPVQNADSLADPAETHTSEFLQFFPPGAPEDTEWVRYDQIFDRRHIVRSNRAAWGQMFFALTTQRAAEQVQIERGGSSQAQYPWPLTVAESWGTIEATSGYIGYVPQLEASYPEIGRVRAALGFRGEPFTQTSSHPQPNSTVLPVHRMQLHWGNFGGMTGRPGRLDRVALVAGSTASGINRPVVEWHTVHWSVRRFTPDYIQQDRPPAELLGLDPFQLVAFQEAVGHPFLGPARDNRQIDMRSMDRLVKFPSGELPAAFCESVHFGAAVGGGEGLRGIIDEIDITDHLAADLVIDEAFREDSQTFKVSPFGEVRAQGLWVGGQDYSAALPATGGLVQIDGEVLAYQTGQDGTFQIAKNGRGLIGSEPRGHDRGARLRFLTQRPCAILTAAVGSRDDKLPIQAMSGLPSRMGTVLLGRTELLHYTWVRAAGQQVTLEMPRFWPPGEDGNSAASHGLFRGRFGTTPVAASAGEPVISFPFRSWDRHVERSDDPEQAYFQLTTREAPVFFRSLQWTEETSDINVDVVCLVRADGRSQFRDEPGKAPMLWQFTRNAGDDKPSLLSVQATQLEVRFAVVYKPGCLDLASFRAHGWKTAPRIKDVRIDYEGEGRVLAERTVSR
ncbi:hypothetical protein LBMAG49_10080 [Planctomycetota bacterium]|nr:hypothetical protein LBMAG49_10080 [Planctomycetota bacterium]